MKKFFFYVSVVIAVYLGINLFKIIVSDLDRLTEYGWGYLSGKVILLLLFGALAFFTYRKAYK